MELPLVGWSKKRIFVCLKKPATAFVIFFFFHLPFTQIQNNQSACFQPQHLNCAAPQKLVIITDIFIHNPELHQNLTNHHGLDNFPSAGFYLPAISIFWISERTNDGVFGFDHADCVCRKGSNYLCVSVVGKQKYTSASSNWIIMTRHPDCDNCRDGGDRTERERCFKAIPGIFFFTF